MSEQRSGYFHTVPVVLAQLSRSYRGADSISSSTGNSVVVG